MRNCGFANRVKSTPRLSGYHIIAPRPQADVALLRGMTILGNVPRRFSHERYRTGRRDVLNDGRLGQIGKGRRGMKRNELFARFGIVDSLAGGGTMAETAP